MRKTTVLALSALALTSIPSLAHAEEFSLHLTPGVSANLTDPQSTIYSVGPSLGASGMFNLHPNFAIGPVVSAAYFPRAVDNGQNAGVLWQVGGEARLQGNREAAQTNEYDTSNVSPWLALDMTLAHTGELYRPSMSVATGLEVSPSRETHSFWFGPFLKYDHLFQTSDTQGTTLLDKNDVNIFTVGISASFDFPVRPKVITHVIRRTETEYVALKPDCAPSEKITPAPEKFELTEHVYFDWDKSSLRWESRDKLNAIAKKLNEHLGFKVAVQGHASSDGQKAHNVMLSSDRTNAVVKYLTAHGVDGSRLVAESYGVDMPTASNATQEGRERNRRVEFTVVFVMTKN
jgi:outer membrane protein OmpA-like peptidoglycan-associated protein